MQDKAIDLKTNILQYKNKRFLNSVAAGSVLIARADGHIDNNEKEKMLTLVSSNDSLSVFDKTEVTKAFNEYLSYFEPDADVGNSKAFEALNKIRGDNAQCRTLMRLVMAIASADGSFDDSEKTIARKIAIELDLPPADFDI
jgi:tellurite resistance protein TerB